MSQRIGRAGRAIAIAASLALAAAHPAQAETGQVFKDGAELYEVCTSDEETDTVACEWFIMGVFDAITLYSDLEYSDRLICVEDSVRASDLRQIVVAYLENTDSLEYTAVSLVFNALDEVYGCGYETVSTFG